MHLGHCENRKILSEDFKVQDCFVHWSIYLFPKWIVDVIAADIVFCWFASFAFYPIVVVAKCLGKKVVIVSGGFDAAAAHAINYGAFTKSPLSRWLRKTLFSMANQIHCVSKANMLEALVNANVSSGRCKLIYHGFEPVKSEIVSWGERKRNILMIAECSCSTVYVKSIDDFLKIASLMTDYNFILVGRVDKALQEYLNELAPKNFRTTGFLPFRGPEFNSLLDESRFIVQLSFYESFGCAVLDGAIRGCYPIASSRYSLFEVASEIGTIFDHGNLKQFVDTIRKIESLEIDCDSISKKVISKFPISKRKELISQYLRNL